VQRNSSLLSKPYFGHGKRPKLNLASVLWVISFLPYLHKSLPTRPKRCSPTFSASRPLALPLVWASSPSKNDRFPPVSPTRDLVRPVTDLKVHSPTCHPRRLTFYLELTLSTNLQTPPVLLSLLDFLESLATSNTSGRYAPTS